MPKQENNVAANLDQPRPFENVTFGLQKMRKRASTRTTHLMTTMEARSCNVRNASRGHVRARVLSTHSKPGHANTAERSLYLLANKT